MTVEEKFLEELELLDERASPGHQEIGNVLTRPDLKRELIVRGGKLVGALGYSVNAGIPIIQHLGSTTSGGGRELVGRLQQKYRRVIAADVVSSARGFYEKLGFRPSRLKPHDMVWER